MIIRSFVKEDLGLKPIHMEIALVPGIPQISILGLPDKVIQESAKRVQTALQAQGFHMPRAKQVLINLNPRELRKSSLGLDLAMALGILAVSGQRSDIEENDLIYGGLHLSGEVFAPTDTAGLFDLKEELITGGPLRAYPFPVKILKNLRDAMSSSVASFEKPEWVRPSFSVVGFSPEVARLLKLIAVGEHSVILAGPPGGGKSTFAENILPLLTPPPMEKWPLLQKMSRYFQQDLKWRPTVAPHHSTSAISMVGGGVPLRPGEIVRAHGGVLILEELLEFDPQVQSALREPMERGEIYVSRGLQRKIFPAQSLVIATTNLCKCGEYVPQNSRHCRCSSLQLRRYLEKFTGPFIDRFTCLFLTQEWQPPRPLSETYVPGEQVLEECEQARAFILQNRPWQKNPNQTLSAAEIIATLESQALLDYLPVFRSHRRRLSLLRVARTLADLEGQKIIQLSHLTAAKRCTFDSFIKLRDP